MSHVSRSRRLGLFTLVRAMAGCGVIALSACSSSGGGATGAGGAGGAGTVHDPATAKVASVDRFSAQAGHLQVRSSGNGLPAANAAVDFDQGPFITQGFGPTGQVVKYYNFDVQPATPAPIYAFFVAGASSPVAGQLNVIDVLPGDNGYNDFWQVMMVTVPSGYVANTVASLAEIQAAGYTITPTDMVVNCPVVPAGSTATLRIGGGSSGLTQGWYRDQVVNYFNFNEATLKVTNGSVPTAPIYVTFNINPDQASGGPMSGFKTETGTMQTHNVPAVVPGQASYSPLWAVSIYDNADFSSVANLTTAMAATMVAAGPLVNCPIVSVQ
ncbi:MAG TPA: hypothetical protein VHO67_22335 [Polyangia bacterium]|nr:hypothetical protein [Polyangia bacterium]